MSLNLANFLFLFFLFLLSRIDFFLNFGSWLDRQFTFPSTITTIYISINPWTITTIYFSIDHQQSQLFKIKTPVSTYIQSISVIDMNKAYRLQNTIYIHITKQEQKIQVLHDHHQLSNVIVGFEDMSGGLHSATFGWMDDHKFADQHKY
jgi:hypothetical protein